MVGVGERFVGIGKVYFVVFSEWVLCCLRMWLMEVRNLFCFVVVIRVILFGWLLVCGVIGMDSVFMFRRLMKLV